MFRHDRHPLPVSRITTDRRLNAALGDFDRTIYQRQISLLDATGLELTLQLLEGRHGLAH